MKYLLVLGVLLLPHGCQTPPVEMTPEEIAQIESVIKAQAEALVTTQNSLDADGFLAYFSKEGLEWVNLATFYGSYEEVDEFIRAVLGPLDSFESGWNDLGVTVLSNEAALSHGNWWGKQVEGNRVTSADPIYWTALHELQADGSWMITRIHQSWGNMRTEEVE